MDKHKVFSEKIKTVRLDSGLTQSEFGKICGANKGTVAQWEGANNYPSIDILIKIGRHFNISIDALLYDELELTSTKTPPADIVLGGVKKAREQARVSLGKAMASLQTAVELLDNADDETAIRLLEEIAAHGHPDSRKDREAEALRHGSEKKRDIENKS